MRTAEAHKGWVWQSFQRASWLYEFSVNSSTSERSPNASNASRTAQNDWALWTLYTAAAYTAFLQVLFYCHSNEAVTILFYGDMGAKSASSKLKHNSHNDMHCNVARSRTCINVFSTKLENVSTFIFHALWYFGEACNVQ